MNNIQEIMAIVERIVNNKERESAIKPDDVLTERGIDSFELIQLIVEIESAFNIEFEAEALTPEALKSIRSISEQVLFRKL